MTIPFSNMLLRYINQQRRDVIHYLKKRVCLRKSDEYVYSLLAAGQPIFLELGSGAKKGINGWVTSDVCQNTDIWLNLLEAFPFPETSVDKIYASHVFEHFTTHQLESILSECLRVLKPGGLLSVCVPNAEIYINAYNHPDTFDPDKFCLYKPAYQFYSKIDYLNYMAYMDGSHHHMFDSENLIQVLRKNGFHNARIRDFDPQLDIQARDYESIYAQGEK